MSAEKNPGLLTTFLLRAKGRFSRFFFGAESHLPELQKPLQTSPPRRDFLAAPSSLEVQDIPVQEHNRVPKPVEPLLDLVS